MLETTTYWFNDNYMDCTGSNSCYMRDKTSTSWVRVTDFYSYWTKKGMSATTSTNKNTITSNANVVFCNTNVHNNATKSTELCQLGFSVSTTHA